VVDDAVCANASLAANSLLTGKLTGNFWVLDGFPQFTLQIAEQIQWLTNKFPTQFNSEFF
jgi:hypothetical protein